MRKRIISLILICVFLLSGCNNTNVTNMPKETERIEGASDYEAVASDDVADGIAIIETEVEVIGEEKITEEKQSLEETQLAGEIQSSEEKKQLSEVEQQSEEKQQLSEEKQQSEEKLSSENNAERLSLKSETIKNSTNDNRKVEYISSDESVVMKSLDEGGVSITWNGVECITKDCVINTGTKIITLYEAYDYDNDGEEERVFSGLVGARDNPITYVMDMIEGELKVIKMPEYDVTVIPKDGYIYEMYINGDEQPLVFSNDEARIDGVYKVWNDDGTVLEGVSEINTWASEWEKAIFYQYNDNVIFLFSVHMAAHSGANTFMTLNFYYELKNGEWKLLHKTNHILIQRSYVD